MGSSSNYSRIFHWAPRENKKNSISNPLVIGHKARDKGCGNDSQENIIGCRGDISDFGQFQAAHQEKNTAHDHNNGHDIGHGIG